MTKAAAIMGSLVDARNVAAHKCMRLTVEIPVERALEAIEAFGWPTGVDPVPVAIARLNGTVASTPSREAAASPSPSHASRQFNDMPLPQQAALTCKRQSFHTFLRENYPDAWRLMNTGTDEEKAALLVQAHCGVKSRSEIRPGTESAVAWSCLACDYNGWLNEPAVLP